jgi:hypothetical protein
VAQRHPFAYHVMGAYKLDSMADLSTWVHGVLTGDAKCPCGEEHKELLSAAIVVTDEAALRALAPLTQWCQHCHRYDVEGANGSLCDMRQPGGERCEGRFVKADVPPPCDRPRS